MDTACCQGRSRRAGNPRRDRRNRSYWCNWSCGSSRSRWSFNHLAGKLCNCAGESGKAECLLQHRDRLFIYLQWNNMESVGYEGLPGRTRRNRPARTSGQSRRGRNQWNIHHMEGKLRFCTDKSESVLGLLQQQ